MIVWYDVCTCTRKCLNVSFRFLSSLYNYYNGSTGFDTEKSLFWCSKHRVNQSLLIVSERLLHTKVVNWSLCISLSLLIINISNDPSWTVLAAVLGFAKVAVSSTANKRGTPLQLSTPEPPRPFFCGRTFPNTQPCFLKLQVLLQFFHVRFTICNRNITHGWILFKTSLHSKLKTSRFWQTMVVIYLQLHDSKQELHIREIAPLIWKHRAQGSNRKQSLFQGPTK